MLNQSCSFVSVDFWSKFKVVIGWKNISIKRGSLKKIGSLFLQDCNNISTYMKINIIDINYSFSSLYSKKLLETSINESFSPFHSKLKTPEKDEDNSFIFLHTKFKTPSSYNSAYKTTSANTSINDSSMMSNSTVRTECLNAIEFVNDKIDRGELSQSGYQIKYYNSQTNKVDKIDKKLFNINLLTSFTLSKPKKSFLVSVAKIKECPA